MRNGGRRAHKLCAEVTRLDDRFRAVTEEKAYRRRCQPWWQRRGLKWTFDEAQ